VLQIIGEKKRRRLGRWIWWIGGLVVALAVVVGWRLWQSHVEAQAEPTYVTAASRRGDVRGTVTATGTLTALDQVDVGAEISGRILVVHVDFNDPVKKGQVLCELDPEQWQAARKQARAQLAASEAELANRKSSRSLAKVTAKRSRSLFDRGLVSEQDLQTAEAAAAQGDASVRSAVAQVALARAALESAETSLRKTKILSPIDGVVLSRNVEPGQTVAAAFQAPVLFTLARDLTQMELHIDIDEADIGQVAEGQRASFSVDTFSGRVFPAELKSIHNIATTLENVVTYEALLVVDNEDLKLRPGMTATVTIITSERTDVLIVPNAALRFTPPSAIERPLHGPMSRLFRPRGKSDSGSPDEKPKEEKPTVWVMRNGKPTPVRIEIGLTDGEWTEVTSGAVTADDQVVVDVVLGRS
jgi:HlyD family secretion protein